MTQEDKQLLLRDLCARLPYGVKANYRDNTLTLDYTIFADNKSIAFGKYPMIYSLDDVECIKPYLRPMSSMTEEERNEYTDIKKGECNGCVLTGKGDPDTEFLLVDWLNVHHFDYRGLIGNGLALEAPKEMYRI